jgi:hypothetical protein
MYAQKVDGLGTVYPTGVVKIKMWFNYTAVAVAVDDVVSLNLADTTYGYMRSCSESDGDAQATALACGIVSSLLDNSGSEDGWIEVQVKGVYGGSSPRGVDCDNGTAAGDPLIASATAGNVKIYVETGLNSPFAIALTADGTPANDECYIYLLDKFNLSSLT